MSYLKIHSLILLLSFLGISTLAPSASAQIFGNKSSGSEVQKSVDALTAAMMDLQRQFEQVKAEKAQLRGARVFTKTIRRLGKYAKAVF